MSLKDATGDLAADGAIEAGRQKAGWVVARLREEYGSGSPAGGDPTDSLIGTILSQHTADRNSGAAFRALKERYHSAHEVAQADVRELAEVIRPAGLANIKAARIQETLWALEARYGTVDLNFLKDLPMEKAREILLALPGVGPKTAACVLLFACDHPALPVDTHVHRVARRLGLIGPKVTAEKAHEELTRLVPHLSVYDFHVGLIRHGRRVCQALHPRCGECVLQAECDYFHSVTGQLIGEDPGAAGDSGF
jgi:endonuclease-3